MKIMNRALQTIAVTSAALLIGNCSEICFDQIGCFNNSSPWASLTRPLPLPRAPEGVCTEVIFYNKNVQNLTLTVFPVISNQLIELYNPRLKTYIISHGYQSSGYFPGFHDMALAILRNKKEVNILLTHWDQGSNFGGYEQVVSNARVAAAVMELVVKKLIQIGGRLDDFHLIGHSIGAHLSAYIGKRLKGKVNKLTGLDPAGLLFSGQPSQVRFSSKDAQYTEALHTSIGVIGIAQPVSQADYYFNAAITQPGCLSRIKQNIITGLFYCPHGLAIRYYISAIENRDCFVGRPVTVPRIVAGVFNTLDFVNDALKTNKCEGTCVKLTLDGKQNKGQFIIDSRENSPYCFL